MQNILKTQLTSFTPVIENKIYNLEALVENDFHFVISEESEIFSVQILQARSTCKLNPKSHITVTECPNKNKNAVHEKLAELKLEHRYIREVTLKVSFIPRPNKTKQTRTFTITMPDKCSLSYFGDDLIIREMLVSSGIEPQSLNLNLDF